MKPKKRRPNYGPVKICVKRMIEGMITKLVLHPRLNLPKEGKEEPFWVVSWRSSPKDNKRNRRFYKVSGKFWEIPIKDACIMFDEMFKEGGLDSKYDTRWNDEIVKIVKYSKRFGSTRPIGRFSEILATKESSDDKAMWDSKNLRAIKFEEPENKWNPMRECWKAMLVDLQRQRVTFRTIANNEHYKQKIKNLARSDRGWFMDNAMMDADPCVMRYFRKYLLRLQKQCRQGR